MKKQFDIYKNTPVLETERLILRPMTVEDAEAAKKMIEYAHEVHGIKTFVSNHAVDNPASGRVMEKCGLKFDHYGEYSTFDGKETFKAKFYKLVLE